MLAQSNWSWQTFFSNTDNVALFCVFGMIVLVVAVPVIAHYWFLAKKSRSDADLKHAMIERGMSADEIERILRAKSPDK